MSETIQPVLSDEDWAKAQSMDEDELMQAAARCVQPIGTIHDARRAIAALNHALPNSDPRKITREKIAALRTMAGAWQDRGIPGEPDPDGDLGNAFLDALASYLPPKPVEPLAEAKPVWNPDKSVRGHRQGAP